MAQSIDRQSDSEPVLNIESRTENGYTYICGGVGRGEAAQMKTASRNHDMLLTFATKKGEYLANVSVDIKDAHGKAHLNTVCDGPLMLIDFPKSGTYRIRAEAAGYTLHKTANVQAKGHTHTSLILSWPQWAADVPSEPETSTGSGGEVDEVDEMMDSSGKGGEMMECR